MDKPEPFPEVRVILQRLEPGQKAVELDYPNNLGKRTKLGGLPDWIQGDQTPVCPACGAVPAFIAQIDSIDYDGYGRKDEAYMFGDVGMIYVFYCLECGDTVSLSQSY